jgi:hypothetical protein
MVDDVRRFVRTRSALVPARSARGFTGVYRPTTDADTSRAGVADGDASSTVRERTARHARISR